MLQQRIVVIMVSSLLHMGKIETIVKKDCASEELQRLGIED